MFLSFLGFLSTADPDNANQPTNKQTFTYKLMGNTVGLPFTIDGNALNSTSSLNYEAHSSWNIAVQSLDSGDPQLSVVKNFQITVVGKLNRSVPADQVQCRKRSRAKTQRHFWFALASILSEFEPA